MLNQSAAGGGVLRRWALNFHRNQGGAIAFLVLAATLIVMMIALVIYDAGQAARDKIQVQAAADAAAWSQSAVEARAMNMLAFTNVAKRVTFGITAFYQAIWIAMAALLVIVIVLAVAACVAAYFTGGALAKLCSWLTELAIEIGIIMAEEAGDLAAFLGDLMPNYFKNDVEALDKYQAYMVDLVPWWSWTESALRGHRNGATFAASFPVPTQISLPSSVPAQIQKFVNQSGLEDTLPVNKDDTSGAYDRMCDLLYSDYDAYIYAAEYFTKTCIYKGSCSGKQYIIHLLTAPMAVGALKTGGCAAAEGFFGAVGAPYELNTYSNDAAGRAGWLLQTSNLVFTYRGNPDRMKADRGKYGYISKDYNSLYGGGVLDLYRAGGYWGMARSEISFQGGAPNLWRPSWTARMRPVALPKEWQNAGISMQSAWRDVLPYIAGGSVLVEGVSGNLDDTMVNDIIRMDIAADAMTNTYIEGLAR